ncbi:MAG: HD domain-containing protein [Vallitalea sp.]|jgi:putative nucleotidyltransferase with HDIG domain|nr:HD domain-containing protein [Vallitalea sp.]
MNNLIELFEEFEYHLINDYKPSDYFIKVIKEKEYRDCYPVKILLDLKRIQQNPKHHPEGNVFNHTMEVVDNAAKISNISSDKRVFMWASLLHDLGKITATKIRKGRITAYDHDKQGEVIAKTFLETFSDDNEFISKVSKLVRWHMQPLFVAKKMPFATVEDMIAETSISEVALLCICDRTGRGPISREVEKKEHLIVLDFLLECYDKVMDDEEVAKLDKIIEYLRQFDI